MAITQEQNRPPPLGFGVPALLPPCRVCGEKGSGFHYGVNTCDSCKGFFQRNHARRSWPVCKDKKACAAAKSRKAICGACKFQKCLDVGMSKKAIRTGRYTYETKTKYTEEVRQLELQARVSSTTITLLSEEERIEELSQMIESITLAHRNAVPDNEWLTSVKEKEQLYTEGSYLKQEMFGELKPLPYEEYEKIYQETGLDLDDRRKILASMVPYMEQSIKKAATFMKGIPGFSKMPLADRVKVLKAADFVNDIISSYHTYGDDGCWIDPDNPDLVYGDAEFSLFYDQEVLDEYGVCVTRLQQLDLTPEEQALLQAYMVVCTDVKISAEGEVMLQSIREAVSDAMLQLLRRNHDDANRFFSRIISVILKLQEVTVMWNEADAKLRGKYMDLQVPHTIVEYYYH